MCVSCGIMRTAGPRHGSAADGMLTLFPLTRREDHSSALGGREADSTLMRSETGFQLGMVIVSPMMIAEPRLSHAVVFQRACFADRTVLSYNKTSERDQEEG